MCCQDQDISRRAQWDERTVSIPAGVATRLCTKNPKRIALIITNTNTGGASLSMRSSVTNTVGIRIDNSANRLEMNYHDHPGLVCQEWWGAGSALQTVNVLEAFDDGVCGEL